MKKILFFGLCFLVMVSLAVIFFNVRTDKYVSRGGTISQRAREYIVAQKKLQDETWRGVSFVDKTSRYDKSSKKRIKVGNCFSVIIPLFIISKHQQGECGLLVRTDEPRGTMTLSLNPSQKGSIDENSGVRLRRDAVKDYSEASTEINGREFIIFTKKGQPYEKSAFSLSSKGLLVVSFSGGESSDIETVFSQMLNSIELKY